MSAKSRARHLTRVGSLGAGTAGAAASGRAKSPVCRRCLRELARADLYPLDGAVLELYLDVRRGDGVFAGLGPLDHATTMGYLSTFVHALASAGERYLHLDGLEWDPAATEPAEPVPSTPEAWDERTAWLEQRDRWREEGDDA